MLASYDPGTEIPQRCRIENSRREQPRDSVAADFPFGSAERRAATSAFEQYTTGQVIRPFNASCIILNGRTECYMHCDSGKFRHCYSHGVPFRPISPIFSVYTPHLDTGGAGMPRIIFPHFSAGTIADVLGEESRRPFAGLSCFVVLRRARAAILIRHPASEVIKNQRPAIAKNPVSSVRLSANHVAGFEIRCPRQA